jgi:peptidoglycan/LPS O-acetylase OafA/YrhL
MSYSYFLLHVLTLELVVPWLSLIRTPTHDDATIAVLSVPIFFAISLLPPIALYLVVERPYSLLQRRSSRQPPGHI